MYCFRCHKEYFVTLPSSPVDRERPKDGSFHPPGMREITHFAEKESIVTQSVVVAQFGWFAMVRYSGRTIPEHTSDTTHFLNRAERA